MSGLLGNAKGSVLFWLAFLKFLFTGSHCPEHAWKLHQFNPNKHSIFAIEQEETDESEVEDEAAYNQLEQELGLNETDSPVPDIQTLPSEQKAVNISQDLKLGRSFVTCGGNARTL